MNGVIIYSTGCPRCNILKKKLAGKNIPYVERSSVEEMVALGIDEVPVMVVNEEQMGFTEAVAWVNSQN